MDSKYFFVNIPVIDNDGGERELVQAFNINSKVRAISFFQTAVNRIDALNSKEPTYKETPYHENCELVLTELLESSKFKLSGEEPVLLLRVIIEERIL